MIIQSQSRGTGKTMLQKALSFILEREGDYDYICESIHKFENELQYCENNCQNMTIECIIRFLSHYELKWQKQ